MLVISYIRLATILKYIHVTDNICNMLDITHGVPLGSVLGPFLFLTFINELPSVIPNSVKDVYADDTTFSSSAHCSLGTFSNAHKAKSRLVTEKRLKSQTDGFCLDLQAGGGAIEQVMHKRIAWGYNRRRTHFQKTC